MVAILKLIYAVKKCFSAKFHTHDLGGKLNLKNVHLLNYIQHHDLVLVIRCYWEILYMHIHTQIYSYEA